MHCTHVHLCTFLSCSLSLSLTWSTLPLWVYDWTVNGFDLMNLVSNCMLAPQNMQLLKKICWIRPAGVFTISWWERLARVYFYTCTHAHAHCNESGCENIFNRSKKNAQSKNFEDWRKATHLLSLPKWELAVCPIEKSSSMRRSMSHETSFHFVLLFHAFLLFNLQLMFWTREYRNCLNHCFSFELRASSLV